MHGADLFAATGVGPPTNAPLRNLEHNTTRNTIRNTTHNTMRNITQRNAELSLPTQLSTRNSSPPGRERESRDGVLDFSLPTRLTTQRAPGQERDKSESAATVEMNDAALLQPPSPAIDCPANPRCPKSTDGAEVW